LQIRNKGEPSSNQLRRTNDQSAQEKRSERDAEKAKAL